jgi:hypothetical protein
MSLCKILLIAAFVAVPVSATLAGEPPLPPEAAAEAMAAPALVEDYDAMATGTVDAAPEGEAEELWMTPSDSAMGGGCHRSKKRQTVYYTN